MNLSHQMIVAPSRAHLSLCLMGIAAALLTSCVVHDAGETIAASSGPAAATETRIESAAGPLSESQSETLIVKISNEAGNSDILARHLAIEQEVAGSPLTAGNAVRVLRDGPETFREIAAAIRAAKHNLNLEYYTIEDITLEDGTGDSTLLSDLLIRKRQEGVIVNIIYDSYGSSDTPADFFTRLEGAGVNLLGFHPLSPINPVNTLTINDRDHRKILVADGAIGVVGGVNLSKDYESKAPGSGEDDEDENDETTLGLIAPLPEEWRDTAVRLEGPAVAELQALFRDQWNAESAAPLDETGLFPDIAAKGKEVVRIIGSTPEDELPRYYVTLISSLQLAETRAWISAAYFVPTPEQKEELVKAATRGVDVRLLLADASDSQIAIEAAQTHYSDLLAAGVRIYETTDVIMHSKTVVIDSVWSAIGSSNFDYRSVLYNDEVEAIVLGAETAAELEKIFEDSLQISTEIDLATWEEERSLPERMKGAFSRIWENLL